MKLRRSNVSKGSKKKEIIIPIKKKEKEEDLDLVRPEDMQQEEGSRLG